ncbi:CDGSH iron-sulfur domain-containing protein [Streptomyces sp. NPDC001389]|uniref:CDGSH iron-sulfur domain-containing protein n=1 Tax=unclassified Streptomyces TaxID=2593676 RepID=UPI0036AB3041
MSPSRVRYRPRRARGPRGSPGRTPATGSPHPWYRTLRTTVSRSPLGQLFLRGETERDHLGRGVLRESRVVLCACGVSGNQPFCDHSGACGKEWNPLPRTLRPVTLCDHTDEIRPIGDAAHVIRPARICRFRRLSGCRVPPHSPAADPLQGSEP